MENTASACKRLLETMFTEQKQILRCDRKHKETVFFYKKFWACDQLKPITGQWITLKKFSLMSCTLEPAIPSCDTGQWMPFLTADHNIDIHWMSTQIVYTLDTQPAMPGHYKNILPP